MFDTIAALGIIGLQIGIVVTIIGWITGASFVKHIARYSGTLIACIFTIAVTMSLIYQYVFGYEPCILCWYQRIAIFPIAISAWLTDIRKNSPFQKQVLVLATIGILIAALHVFVDMFPGAGVDVCGAAGASCLVRYVYQFGYITIPMMSFTVLASGILLALLAKRYPADSTTA